MKTTKVHMAGYRIYGFAAMAVILAFSATAVRAKEDPKVGLQADKSQIAATSQLIRPAGLSAEFKGRPVDIALSPDNNTAYILDNRGLVVMDAKTWKIRQETSFPEGGGGSMHGIAVTKDGKRVFACTANNLLWEANVIDNGNIKWSRKILFPGPNQNAKQPAALWGIALSSNEKTGYVTLSRNNTLATVDMVNGKMTREIPVGVAPYDVILSVDEQTAYVSDWGGRHPERYERSATSAGTDTLVDKRGVACSGVVSIVDLKEGRETGQIETGLHPCDMELSRDGRLLYVANANSDTISVIDLQQKKVVETITVRPDKSLPFGSAPNGLKLSKNGKMLYAANGGNNAIAVIALGNGAQGKSVVQGFIPTAWYPSAIATDGKNLYIANTKGFGSRGTGPDTKKWTSWNLCGTAGKVGIPSHQTLEKYTAKVLSAGHIPQILRAMEKSASKEKAVPVPARLGQSSVFDHVVYIIKENKTYDQMFGDLPKGNNDPSLCIYGKEISPNHHALATQFVQLDNFYCNGVCSADGHSWATEGNVTDHLEKSFGGFTRSYTFGDDPLTYSSSGLIWDDVLSHGLSFRNYGEMDDAKTAPNGSWSQVYEDHIAKTGKYVFLQNIGIENLRNYSCPDSPGWNLGIPDLIRADAFLKELDQYDKVGGFPNFTIIHLPNDHTSGGTPGFPTPRAQVADNDLALGRIVEGISKSQFWARTCIFVIEDDPQSGFDHVDGHRSLCLVISPYTKREALVSKFYNQTSVLHTMEQIMGIPPMNQMDAMAPLMTECFTEKPDYAPFVHLKNNIALDEMNKTSRFYKDKEYWANGGKQPDFDRPDNVNDDEFNRAIWYSIKGDSVPYPANMAGAHGKGLKELNLAFSKSEEESEASALGFVKLNDD